MARISPLLPLAACALLTPGLAHAGGLGVFAATGVTGGQVLSGEGGNAVGPNVGGGLEVWLGTTTSRLKGRARIYYLGSFAGTEEHMVTASFGAAIEVLPNVDQRFGLYGNIDLGASLVIVQHREEFFGDVGAGVRYRLKEDGPVDFFGELNYELRFRGVFRHGARVNLGLRFSLGA